MQQVCGENKMILGEIKFKQAHIPEDISLQWHESLVWTIDIIYF